MLTRILTRLGLPIAWVSLVPRVSFASFLSGETMDKAASVIAVVVLFIVPVVVIVLFWMVHVLPEKIAEKRHHPQKEAIHVLCLLSLVFGGLLWPLAWLWAYSKPVLHKLAYGTDKHADYYAELAAEPTQSVRPAQPVAEIARLQAEVDGLIARGVAPGELTAIRERLAALKPQLADATQPEESR